MHKLKVLRYDNEHCSRVQPFITSQVPPQGQGCLSSAPPLFSQSSLNKLHRKIKTFPSWDPTYSLLHVPALVLCLSPLSRRVPSPLSQSLVTVHCLCKSQSCCLWLLLQPAIAFQASVSWAFLNSLPDFLHLTTFPGITWNFSGGVHLLTRAGLTPSATSQGQALWYRCGIRTRIKIKILCMHIFYFCL